MKIKRFVASDMRQAMKLVREEQGPDAVILSTRRLPEGIEIIAALDYDEALVREAARHGTPAPGSDEAPTPAVKAPTPVAERMRLAERNGCMRADSGSGNAAQCSRCATATAGLISIKMG